MLGKGFQRGFDVELVQTMTYHNQIDGSYLNESTGYNRSHQAAHCATLKPKAQQFHGHGRQMRTALVDEALVLTSVVVVSAVVHANYPAPYRDCDLISGC